ncbi:MAG: phosphate ABC transporter permease PstA [Acidobacteriia bacterium]|nr:phosphate ABC transporter permease PstA [Methyloceanibacter sp.]MCL6490334.1 phosphate ABC transporter permease PstA [Terriglobia bacterium]
MNLRKTHPRGRSRKRLNVIALGLATLATALGLVGLASILITTLLNGAAALRPSLFTELTPPPGAEGGLANALFGSLLLIFVAVVMGTPIGILAGTYLAEYNTYPKLVATVRFINDILLSAPSVVIGLFVYQVIVWPSGHFSGWAGAIALALILLPVVIRTTDETMQLIPLSLREAALALGAPKWRVITQVIYRAARAGILTGVLLGIARISGETAPLLFTALNNQYWSTDLSRPLANVPVVIFQFALSPYESWHGLAWAGALLLTLLVLVVSILARSLLREKAE